MQVSLNPLIAFFPPPQYGYDDSPAPENNFFVDGDGNLTVGDGIIRPMGLDAVSNPNQYLYLHHQSLMDSSQVLILKILKILTLVKQLETLTAPF
jgi:hypothetical protein